MNFDPNILCLESPEFGSVPLMFRSSGHLLLSLVNRSNTVDQCTLMIHYQNYSSGFVNSVQKREAEPDEKRAADSSVVRCRSGHPDEFIVPLDDPNEEITEQWQDGLHDW